MRVLILAESCNPQWPSLPVVAYKACRAIADHAEVLVATHVRNRSAISEQGCGRAEVAFLDNEYIASPLFKVSKLLRGGTDVSWTTAIAASYLPYLAFEWEAWKRFGGDLRAGRFDVVHRITPMSPTIPSPMAKWSPVPFVLGPLNGGLRWPAEFARELRREREFLTYARSAYRRLPYHRATYVDAAAILAAFRHTMEDLPRSALPRAIEFPEVGIDPELFSLGAGKRLGDRLTFLFVGRLVPYKCADVAIRAFARSRALQRHRLLMVGEGPERERLASIVSEHHLRSCVELTGWRDHGEIGEIMRSADVFVFPSIRELGAGVVVEAMACGCAPVVVDYGAPRALVTESCGIRVPLGSKRELVDGFAAALEALTEDPERRARLGEAAHRRAMRHFSWDAKAMRMLEVYRWVTGERRDKPEFETREGG
jgi:glycosyltransferase involved in cell wall biosynthesis